MGRKKIYTEEEQKERRKISIRKYYQKNKEKLNEKNKEYYQKNKDIIKEREKVYHQKNKDIIKERTKEYRKEYRKTKNGRALNLLVSYKISDKKYNRGECTLTREWIVENIFSSKCVYCGESDWRKLGCDRKDNSLSHSPDNCVPCCFTCNTKKRTKSYEEYMKEINKL